MAPEAILELMQIALPLSEGMEGYYRRDSQSFELGRNDD